jgi:hypothetical protein
VAVCKQREVHMLRIREQAEPAIGPQHRIFSVSYILLVTPRGVYSQQLTSYWSHLGE